MADKHDRPIALPKRGGYQGGKPSSAMKPPVRTPAAGFGSVTRDQRVAERRQPAGDR